MKCKYCKKEMHLERFVDRSFENGLIDFERFVFYCPSCSIVISPRFIALDQAETNEEKELLRNIYLKHKESVKNV